jgi:hypothetical protein
VLAVLPLLVELSVRHNEVLEVVEMFRPRAVRFQLPVKINPPLKPVVKKVKLKFYLLLVLEELGLRPHKLERIDEIQSPLISCHPVLKERLILYRLELKKLLEPT